MCSSALEAFPKMILAVSRGCCDYVSREKSKTFNTTTGTIAGGSFTFPMYVTGSPGGGRGPYLALTQTHSHSPAFSMNVNAGELIRVELWADLAKDVYLGGIELPWTTVRQSVNPAGPVDPPITSHPLSPTPPFAAHHRRFPAPYHHWWGGA